MKKTKNFSIPAKNGDINVNIYIFFYIFATILIYLYFKRYIYCNDLKVKISSRRADTYINMKEVKRMGGKLESRHNDKAFT